MNIPRCHSCKQEIPLWEEPVEDFVQPSSSGNPFEIEAPAEQVVYHPSCAPDYSGHFGLHSPRPRLLS